MPYVNHHNHIAYTVAVRVYEQRGPEDGYDFAEATLHAVAVAKRYMRRFHHPISDRVAHASVLKAAAPYSN